MSEQVQEGSVPTHTITINIKGREYELTPEQADRVARRMADREGETVAWEATGMLLLDFARLDEGDGC